MSTILPTNKIQRTTIFLALCTIVSRILGFVRIGFISAYFGAGGQADILNVVLSVPNNLRKLFAEGALTNAFMPGYASTVHNSIRANPKSQQFFSGLLGWAGIIVLLFTIIVSRNSEVIIRLLFHFTDQQDIVLAAKLFSMAIYYLWFMTVCAILSGLQQTHKYFINTSTAPMMLSVAVVITIVLWHNSMGIFSVVYGFIFGGMLQTLWLIIPLVYLGYKLYPTVTLTSLEIKSTFVRFFPSIGAVLLPIISQQIMFRFASALPEGSASAFSYAIVFWQFPIGVIINSVVSVSFVYLVSLVSTNNWDHAQRCVSNAYLYLSMFMVPVTILFFFLSHAGVAVTLQRGALNADAVILTAKILQGYALGLLPLGFYLMMQKTLYALKKNTAVLLYTAAFTIIDILLTYYLINTSLGARGLSVAYTITLLIIVPCMYIHVSKHIKHTINIPILLKIGIANIPLALFVVGVSIFSDTLWDSGSSWRTVLSLMFIAVISLVLIVVGYKLVHIDIIHVIRNVRNKED